MSSKPLAVTRYSFITLLWGDICDKMEQRERQNGPERSYCGNSSGVSDRLCDLHLPRCSPGFYMHFRHDGRVSETPWQVGRHAESLMLTIDGNKLQ